MNKREAHTLLKKYTKGLASPEEITLLELWYLKNSEQEIPDLQDQEIQIKKEIWDQLQLGMRPKRKNGIPYKLAAAAAIVICLSVGLWVYLADSFQQGAGNAGLELRASQGTPSTNLVEITLSNGKRIELKDTLQAIVVHAGEIAQLNGTSLYTSERAELAVLRTPYGGQSHLVLPDGTHVWLNAGSSLRFPTQFSADSRGVELQGEAYFEVAKLKGPGNQHVPFLVKTRQQTIEVLGTHFNVNAYEDEGSIQTTLLEGSVGIRPLGSPSSTRLKPGQQSSLSKGQLVIEQADLEAVMAWRNGDFVFNNEALVSIMKKIARWYDVEILYELPTTDVTFSGVIARTKSLEAVLEVIEQSSELKFRTQGRRVYVSK